MIGSAFRLGCGLYRQVVLVLQGHFGRMLPRSARQDFGRQWLVVVALARRRKGLAFLCRSIIIIIIIRRFAL